MKKRHDPNETWCRKNVTTEEHDAFWKNWMQTQDGMPTFSIMRLVIENLRAAASR